MKATIENHGHVWDFVLKQNDTDSVSLECGSFYILNITPKGLTRYTSAQIPGVPFDDRGRIAIRGIVDDRDKYATNGKRDVQIKLVPDGTTLYIDAVHKDSKGHEKSSHICYINDGGLYIWINDEHKKNCYASSKNDTILLKE